MERIGIIGTRKRNTRSDYQIVHDTFFEIYQDGDWIVSGHCPKGGDAFAEKIAYDYGIPILLCPPKKHIAVEYFARNTLIAKYSTKIIACLMNPSQPLNDILERKSGGSEDTLKKFWTLLGLGEKSNDIHPSIKKRIIIV